MKEYKILDPQVYEVIERNPEGVHGGYLLEERETMKRFMFKEINPWPAIAAAFVAKKLGFSTPEIEAVKPWWETFKRTLPDGTKESGGTLEEWVWETLNVTQLMYHWDPVIREQFLHGNPPVPLSFRKASKDWGLLKYLVGDDDKNTGNFLVKYKNGEAVDWVAIDMEKAFAHDHKTPAYIGRAAGNPTIIIREEAGDYSMQYNPLNHPPYNLASYQKLKFFLRDKQTVSEHLSAYIAPIRVSEMWERVDNVLGAIKGHVNQMGSEKVFNWAGWKNI